MNSILEVELFDIWGIDFIGPFPSSYNNQYILLVVNYVSMWIEGITTPKNDAKVVLKFLKKKIFTRFGTPRAIIRGEGTHFCSKQFEAHLLKYGVKLKLTLAYHPQTNGQDEISNKEVKKILDKKMSSSRKYWA